VVRAELHLLESGHLCSLAVAGEMVLCPLSAVVSETQFQTGGTSSEQKPVLKNRVSSKATLCNKCDESVTADI